jgi:hypothetical protein
MPASQSNTFNLLQPPVPQVPLFLQPAGKALVFPLPFEQSAQAILHNFCLGKIKQNITGFTELTAAAHVVGHNAQ